MHLYSQEGVQAIFTDIQIILKISIIYYYDKFNILLKSALLS